MYSIPMALCDLIPVFFFAFGCFKLIKYLKNKINKINLVLVIIGVLMVVIAGTLKASYKLLYAFTNGTLNIMWLSNQFFANQSFGFMIAGIALVLTFIKSNKNYAILPTMALVGMQVLGLGLVDFSIVAMGAKKKNKKVVIFMIISFVTELMMGYLATKQFDSSLLNWIAQGVNTFGQIMFYLGISELVK